MKNKDLIAHLQQFDDDMEVFVFDRANIEEWAPEAPTIHFDFDNSHKKEFIVIPFAYKFDGN